MELIDTIDLMTSDNYKDRLKAEYLQTKIRYDKLHHMLVQYEAGTLPFDLSCPLEVLEHQAHYMGHYLKTLEIRAEIEKVEL